MRTVVVSPPRSGNHWIECLLGTIYDLRRLGGSDKPEETKGRVFREWAGRGGFPDGSLFHLHCRYRSELADEIEAVPAKIVTVVRDPYDAFVSRYFWTQQRMPADRERAERRPRQRMVGKPLDDPQVLAFLADPNGLGSHLRMAQAKVGDSKGRLSEAHLVIFRERYADVVKSLGYDVR